MYKYASSSSHRFVPVNGANSFFAHCTAFFRSLGETESDRASAYVEEIRIGDTSYCCLWREEDAHFFLDREWRDSSRTCPDRWGSDNAFDLATVIFDGGDKLDLATVRPIGDIIFSDYIKAGIADFGFLDDIAGTFLFVRDTSRAEEAEVLINSVSSSPLSELAGGEVANVIKMLDNLYAEQDEYYSREEHSASEERDQADSILSWTEVLNGQHRETLSKLTLKISRQLHSLAVKAYADNFLESDIPTLRRLAQLPTCSPATFALFYREDDDVYSNPVDDPRYVTIDEVVKNIMYHQEV
jgi:hypothetical protein|nr:MAG TPA: hypothetical protein [Caudoviricetes sp.]